MNATIFQFFRQRFSGKVPAHLVPILRWAFVLQVFGLGTASAQFSLTGTSYTQNFDGLGTSNLLVTGGNLGSHSSTLTGWYFAESGSNANTTITAGTGSSSAGDSYNFGAGSDRALGGLLSGSLVPSWGFYFTNDTGSAITALDIGYTGETWRVGTASRSDRIDFQYSLNATSLTSGTWVDFNSLDYANPGQATTGNGSVQHSASISDTISALTILNGESFFLRWTDFNASGADDGMAVDDFSLTATLLSGSPNLYWLGADTDRGGTGTWTNTGGTAWSEVNANGGPGVEWDSTKTAIFNTAAATVTVSGTVDADRGITFDTGTDGSTISGGTAIDLGGASAAENAMTTASGVTATISTALTGSNGFQKAGAGGLVLSGDNSGLSGAVDLASGSLLAGHNSALGTGAVTMAGGTTLAASDAAARTLANNLTVNGDVTFGQSSGGTGDLTITGTVTLGAANRKITVANPLTVFQGAVSGTGDFDKEGVGTLRFGATTHNLGALDINGGLVDLAAGATVNSAMGANKTWDGGLSGTGALNIANSGTRTLQLNSAVDSSGYSGAVSHSGGGEINVRSVLNPLGTGVLTVETTNTVIRTNGTSQTGLLGNSSIALNPNDTAGFQLNIGATSGNALTVGSITEAGSQSSSVSFQSGTGPGGAGTLTINGASSYGGATLFNGANSFTFKNGIDNALPTTTAVTMGATASQGGAWDLNGYNQTIAALSSGPGSGSITNTGIAAGNLTVNGSSDTAFAFVIGNGTGGVALTKAGSSTLTLSGENTYEGATTISGGRLALSSASLNSTIGSSSSIFVDTSAFLNVTGITAAGGFQVGASQTLSGTGTVEGDTTILGTLAAGTGPGSMTMDGDLTFDTGSTWLVDLVHSVTPVNGMTHDFVSVTGQIAFTGGTLSVVESGSYVFGPVYTIANYGTWDSSTLTGLPDGGFVTGSLGGQFQINYNDGGNITLTAVPEPEAFLPLLVALIPGIWLARRRMKRGRGNGVEA